jgi:hypothetical protein
MSLPFDEGLDATSEASRIAQLSVCSVFSEAQRRVELFDEIVRVAIRPKRVFLKHMASAVAERLTNSVLASAFVTWKALVDTREKSWQAERQDLLSQLQSAKKAASKERLRWAAAMSIGTLRLCTVAWRNLASQMAEWDNGQSWQAQMCGERADLLAQVQRAKKAASEERLRWAEEHQAHKRTQDQLDQALDCTLQGLSKAEKVSNARESRISQLTGANGWLQLKVSQLENDLNKSRAREGQALLRLDKVLASQAAAIQSRNVGKRDEKMSSTPAAEADTADTALVFKVLPTPFHDELTRAAEKRARAANMSSKRTAGGTRRPKPRDDVSALQETSHCTAATENSSNHGRKGGSIRRASSTSDLTSSSRLDEPNWTSGTDVQHAQTSSSGGRLSADQSKPMAGALRPQKRPASAGASRPPDDGSPVLSVDFPTSTSRACASSEKCDDMS